jgi:uncharacterized protein YbjT (DUF2867 family)
LTRQQTTIKSSTQSVNILHLVRTSSPLLNMAVIAVVGGTGGLGSNITKACAENSLHKVIVVSRETSKVPEWLQRLKNVEIRKVDYSSDESLKNALQGVDTVYATHLSEEN